MAKRGDTDGRGKALDLWQAPEGAGEPRFCIATTFTFNASFFEVECLGRFLQMDTHPQESESVGYLIEREMKLAEARVCVLADRRHAIEKESLRWDVLPVVVPRAVQHAKLALLGWSNCVRLVIGSGNLTKPGYRENLEVFGCLETWRQKEGSRDGVLEAVGFLEQMAELALGDEARPGPKQRLRAGLAAARALVGGWPQAEQRRAIVAPVFGGVGSSLVDQLRNRWPSNSPPRYLYVLSPFFDASEGAPAVIDALAQLMAKRGEKTSRFYVPIEELPDGRVRVKVPRSLIDAARGHGETFLHGVPPKQRDELQPMHAKMLALANDDWQLLLIGSSNCTRAGLGVAEGAANLEANLAYLARDSEPEYRALDAAWPDCIEDLEIDNPTLVWDPAFDPDGEGGGPAPLPAAFREALFDAASTPPRLILTLDKGLPPTWAISTSDGHQVLRSDQWIAEAPDAVIPWTERKVPFVLHVTWGEEPPHAADWPVNVVDAGALPPPDELRDLTLEELLEVLASTRPLHQSVVAILRKRSRQPSRDVELDPHKRVNTETFLLRRTSRLLIGRFSLPLRNAYTAQICKTRGIRSRAEGDKRRGQDRATSAPEFGSAHRMAGGAGPRPARSQPRRARIPEVISGRKAAKLT
jgi:hypothetical protein